MSPISTQGLRRHFQSRLVLMFLYLALCSLPLWAQQPADGYAESRRAARETAWKAITNGQGSAAAIAIMHKGKLVVSEGVGVKDWALNTPVDKHTRFNIGSTSKMFVAVAVLMLVDEGRVALDDPVVKYIPEFKMLDERYKVITVRMLFNHSSGLPGTSSFIGYAADHNVYELLLDTLAGERLKHQPGAFSMYCNDGFTLAEILVERVSGQPFMEFLEARVLTPLAMHDTGPSLGELPAGANIAEYFDSKSGKKYPAEVMEGHAVGGLSSTVEDLCRFGDSFSPKSKQKLLSDASLREIRTTQPNAFSGKLKNRTPFSEFGWDYSNLSPFDKEGLQVLGKGGNTIFYSTNLQILPDQGISIALCISGSAFAEKLTRPVLTALLTERKLIARSPVRPSKPPQAQVIPAELRKFAGFYINDSPMVLRLSISDDNKEATLAPTNGKGEKKASDPLATLIYHDGAFYSKDGNVQCYFSTIEGRTFLVTTPFAGGSDFASTYSVDFAIAQKVEPLVSPVASMAIAEDGKHWLVRTAPASVSAGMFEWVLVPTTYDGLDGYVNFSGLKKIESATYGSIAADTFRDQTELNLREQEGTRWAELGPLLYSLTSPTKSTAGLNTIVIGAEGHNEWLELKDDSVATIARPGEGSRLIIFAPADHRVLYDSVVDSEDLFLPKGSLIVCAGRPGASFPITLE